jgi:hypothetical protein
MAIQAALSKKPTRRCSPFSPAKGLPPQWFTNTNLDATSFALILR